MTARRITGRLVAGGLAVLLAFAAPAAGLMAAPTFALAATPVATNPLAPGLPAATGTATPTPTPTASTVSATTTAGSSTLSSSSTLVVAVGALIVLGGISLFIWRDARRRAPVRAGSTGAGIDGRGRTGSKPPPKPRKLSAAERRRRKRGRAR